MSSIISLVQRVRTMQNPVEAKPLPDSKPIKFGILGAAAIAPSALIDPAKSHPEAVVYAVAARSHDRAAAFAKKHNIEKVFGGPNGYQELIDSPEIDAIYNPLPNGLHYEWTMKALAAGKHVLLEKPAANTAEETRKMFELADHKGLVLLEAFHYRFHPVANRVKAIIESGELGPVKSTKTSLAIPRGIMKPDDIRFNYSIGGGALMDMGCYTINAMRYFAGVEPTSVLSVEHDLDSPQVDRKTVAKFALPGNITSTIFCDLAMPPALKIIPQLPDINATIECEKGRIQIMNYVMPTAYHSITVTPTGKKSRVEKAYTFPDLGEPWWSSYRYQLEAFINKVKGRPPHVWVTKEDSIKNMEVIESVYAKSGLGSRPKSEYVPPSSE
ncbi:NAD(P)-binding protein [Mycena maculata]|uniref:D-xylose 1-dehydrogenase (NADP(+), D-xylono-1,5-lactone-forming) n=1 Tax=Mycena maculata TaxID=230809 RepID=A0AAD7KBC8_9AGAR|nr:NAD(P)-binding protein [Mycena maculata]